MAEKLLLRVAVKTRSGPYKVVTEWPIPIRGRTFVELVPGEMDDDQLPNGQSMQLVLWEVTDPAAIAQGDAATMAEAAQDPLKRRAVWRTSTEQVIFSASTATLWDNDIDVATRRRGDRLDFTYLDRWLQFVSWIRFAYVVSILNQPNLRSH